MDTPRVRFFAVAGCPFCDVAREALRQCGEPFEEFDPTGNPDVLRELLRAAASATVPTIVVGERVLVGFDQERFEEILREPPLEPLSFDDPETDALLESGYSDLDLDMD